MFTVQDGLVSLRFRLDELARFGPRAESHIPALRAAIERHAWSVPARVGTGYLVDNRRWLHGRRDYTGPRLVYRILADPARPGLIDGGFPARLGRMAAGRGASDAESSLLPWSAPTRTEHAGKSLDRPRTALLDRRWSYEPASCLTGVRVVALRVADGVFVCPLCGLRTS